MKRVEIKKEKDGRMKTVETPWLRIEEAAAYCGISRSAFCERSEACGVPHGGDEIIRLYNTRILDAWIMGHDDFPFDHRRRQEEKRTARRNGRRRPSENILINPNTGKVGKGRNHVS